MIDHKKEDGRTDFTVEVCNVCAGSCTGCMLSAEERRDYSSAMSVDALALALDRVLEYGEARGIGYRPILAFGDVVRLPLKDQKALYEVCDSRFGSFGLTLTLADDDWGLMYYEALGLLSCYKDVTFDITIDPFRMESRPSYLERLKFAASEAVTLHLQVLLSTPLMTKYTGESLAKLLDEHFPGRPVSIGFTPTVDRLEASPRYRYATNGAALFATEFYQATETGRKHLASEIERFEAWGSYLDFAQQSFHVGSTLDLYPVVYTVFGDLVLDWRNGCMPLGSLKTQSVEQIMSSYRLRSLSSHNAGWLVRGEGCQECVYCDACQFNGVGLARKSYSEFETRAGCCYGPVALLAIADQKSEVAR